MLVYTKNNQQPSKITVTVPEKQKQRKLQTSQNFLKPYFKKNLIIFN